jgi:hypothetical protein
VIRSSPVCGTVSGDAFGGGGNTRGNNRPISPAESTKSPDTSPTATAETTAAQGSISVPGTTTRAGW